MTYSGILQIAEHKAQRRKDRRALITLTDDEVRRNTK